MRRYLFPLILGVVGCAILVGLGLWQLQRLEWKQALLDDIQQRIDGPPVALPRTVTPDMKYLPVAVSGTTTGEEIDVLSGTREGAGYQVITGLVTDDGRRILVDLGFVDQDHKREPRPPVHLEIVGNLHWPDEAGGATPAPNLERNIWFARDVPAMARHLDTEPVLLVAARVTGDSHGVVPRPIGIEGIPNNHLSYAVQWFLIALAWAGMTVGLIWRIRQRRF